MGILASTFGVLAGVSGLGIRAPHTWSREHLPGDVRHFLAGLWPWLFGVCAVNGVFLVVGSVVLVYLFGLDEPDLFVGSYFFAVVSLLLTVFAGVSYDVQRIVRGAVVHA
jgi:hypothetical protein